jgi:division protein CdvB (Snf7/Vps24/ESCRT-III family)
MSRVYTHAKVLALRDAINEVNKLKDSISDSILEERKLLAKKHQGLRDVNTINQIFDVLKVEFAELEETEKVVEEIYQELERVTHSDMETSIVKKANDAIKIIDQSKKLLSDEMKKCQKMLDLFRVIEDIIHRHSRTKKGPKHLIKHLEDMKELIVNLQSRLSGYHKDEADT